MCTKEQYLREQFGRYLKQEGYDPENIFQCLNPEHGTSTSPSMTYDADSKIVCCATCGTRWDIAEFFRVLYGETATQKLYERFGLAMDDGEIRMDYTEYLNAITIPTDTNSVLGGIFPDEVVRLKILRYDEAFYTDDGEIVQAIILPIEKKSFYSWPVNKGVCDWKYRCYRGRYYGIAFGMKDEDRGVPLFFVNDALSAVCVYAASGAAVCIASLISEMGLKNMDYQVIIAENSSDKQKEKMQKTELTYIEYNISCGYDSIYEAYKNSPLLFKRAIRAAKEKVNYGSALANPFLSCTASSILANMQNVSGETIPQVFPTGFSKLDTALYGGLREGITVIGAPPSIGKSTFVSQITDNLAQAGHDVLIVTLEMPKESWLQKSLSRLTSQVCQRLENTKSNAKSNYAPLSEQEIMRYLSSSSKNYALDEALKLYQQRIEPSIALIDTDDISKKMLGLAYKDEIIGPRVYSQFIDTHARQRGGSPIVVVDYLQLITVCGTTSEKQSVDIAMKELREMSNKYRIPVIVISSVSRAFYDEALTINAFKESGNIEYGADVIVVMEYDGVGSDRFKLHEAQSGQKGKIPYLGNARTLNVRVLKNRIGSPTETIQYSYYPKFNLFVEDQIPVRQSSIR